MKSVWAEVVEISEQFQGRYYGTPTPGWAKVARRLFNVSPVADIFLGLEARPVNRNSKTIEWDW